MTVDVNITGLSAGDYLDSVTVSSGEADNSPQFAYVTLEVTTIAANIITLDQVNNVSGGDTVITDGYIPVGDTVRFTFRLTYTDGTSKLGGSSNGFEVYEENGGDFFPIVCDTLPIGWDAWYEMFFFSSFSVDGMGADTIGFSGIDIFSTLGIPVGFDLAVWYIESGSDIDGDTLCIDSSYFPPSGEWLWLPQGDDIFTPDWGGPYCYPIQGEVEIPPTVAISPDTIRVFQANAIDTIWTFIYLGNFTDGHTVNDIDPSSLIINSSMTPTSWAILPSHPGFVGEVMEMTLPIRDFILYYGLLWDATVQVYTVEGDFVSKSDFSVDGEVTMIGHTSGDLDGDGAVTVSDLTYLVAYLFTGGKPPVMEAADVDHDGMVTVSDLTTLVYLLFG
ncbi:MAG: dockerin type I repeat-containing protein [bacterium]